jgi:hypothetical protein
MKTILVQGQRKDYSTGCNISAHGPRAALARQQERTTLELLSTRRAVERDLGVREAEGGEVPVPFASLYPHNWV